MADLDLGRLNTVNTQQGDVEVGVTDAIQSHFARHVVQRKPVSQRKLDFEHRRPRWLRECLAEGAGVFFYVYGGVSSVAAFTLNVATYAGTPTDAGLVPAFGSFLQIGFAFALGIAFAIIVCAPTSGGHFNPAVTICLWFWQGFPTKKVPYYIFSQIVGSFLAAAMIYGQYHEQITAFAQASIASGAGTVYNGGPASIFMSLPAANQTNLGYLFLIEFFVDSFIGLVIWAVLDPANPFVAPSTAPFVIGLAYAVMIWGFADITISTNLARDLGCRSFAAILYGGEVFSYHNYSWISILVNIPATFFATCFYELVFRDSLQKLGKGAAIHEEGDEGLRRHWTNYERRALEMEEAENMNGGLKRTRTNNAGGKSTGVEYA